MKYSSKTKKAGLLLSINTVSFILLIASGLCAQSDPVQQYINDLQNGPALYYTDQAINLLSTKDATIAANARSDQDKAMKALKATALLGDKGGKGAKAIDMLLQMYPLAIHCVTVNEQYVPGAGTFEDWLQTKIMGEKNKFILKPPFLTYDDISQCDGFIEETHDYATAGERYGAAGRMTEGYVTINVTFKYYAGACALSRITGQNLGIDINQWRSWWDMNRANFQPSAGPAASNTFAPGAKSMDDVVKGGTYHFVLTTGDDFTGVVDSNDDTSMIVETREGKGYTFKNSLVKDHQLVSLPAQQVKKQSATVMADITQPEIVTFDALKQRGLSGVMLEVKIKSGQTFRGVLTGMDDEMLRLTIEGSQVPIARNVADQITIVPSTPAKAATEAKQVAGPQDTLIVQNPKVDDWGKRLPSFVYVGIITKETNSDVTIKKTDGGVITVQRGQVEQVKRYSNSGTADPIVKYAKPLFCPQGMALVDIPPGKEGRPYFKVCIDKYEYPNMKDAIPQSNISFADSKKACERQGKRLCTAEEWQWSCGGLEQYVYPYGHVFEQEACNATDRAEPSGTRYKCVSKFGVADMAGNIFEWVSDAQGNALAMGGPMSKCQTRAPGAGGDPKPQTGFRCCKSN
jgi:hypothetical protein